MCSRLLNTFEAAICQPMVVATPFSPLTLRTSQVCVCYILHMLTCASHLFAICCMDCSLSCCLQCVSRFPCVYCSLCYIWLPDILYSNTFFTWKVAKINKIINKSLLNTNKGILIASLTVYYSNHPRTGEMFCDCAYPSWTAVFFSDPNPYVKL